MSDEDKPKRKRRSRASSKGSKSNTGAKKRTSRKSNDAVSKSSSSPQKKRQRRKRKSKTSKPKLEASKIRVKQLFFCIASGAILGFLTIAWALYFHAEQEIRLWLEPKPVQHLSGRVFSAPLLLQPNLWLDVDDVAQFLQSSGYARVAQADQAGDFQVINPEQLVLYKKEGKGQGKKYTIFFVNGRISKIQNHRKKWQSKLILSEVELAEIRGKANRAQRKVSLDNVPEHLWRSVLAVEDSRFFEHQGVDIFGVVRAIAINVIHESKRQGASTITQQLVKNLILVNSEKTYKRKAREAIRALALERVLHQELSQKLPEKEVELALKKKILEIYLNEVYMGNAAGVSIVGVEQASRVFFGKSASRLSIGEAATLAGIISAPNGYSPIRHPERAQKRRNIALKRMVAMKWLDKDVAEHLQQRPFKTHVTPMSKQAPWFVEFVLGEAAKEKADLSIEAMEIHSTLQPSFQKIAEKSVSLSMTKLEKKYPKVQGVQVALVAIRNQDGAVVAMVGGRDYAKSQFNRATLAKRQVGSIVKPLLALFAMNDVPNIGPGCWLKDEPLTLTVNRKSWSPKNYDKQFKGHVSLRETIAQSRNIPIVNLYQHMVKEQGPNWMSSYAKKIGLDQVDQKPANSLGSFRANPLSMAAAYTIFPNLGRYVAPYSYRSIVFRNQKKSEESNKKQPQKVTSSSSAWMALDMMREVIETGTGRSAAAFGATGDIFGKTGTSNDARDAWFVGADKYYSVAVWVGYDKGKPLGLGGGKAALPTWSRFMAGIAAGQKKVSPVKGLVQRSVCLDAPECIEQERDWFHKKAKIDQRCSITKDVIFQEEEPEEEGFIFRILPFLRKKNKDKQQ